MVQCSSSSEEKGPSLSMMFWQVQLDKRFENLYCLGSFQKFKKASYCVLVRRHLEAEQGHRAEYQISNNNVTVSIALFWFRGISLCYKLNLNCFDHVFPGHHVDMAEEHGALLVALEHRFYGDSINPDGLKTENLASLSSQQALVMASYLSVCVCLCVYMYGQRRAFPGFESYIF